MSRLTALVGDSVLRGSERSEPPSKPNNTGCLKDFLCPKAIGLVQFSGLVREVGKLVKNSQSARRIPGPNAAKTHRDRDTKK